MCNSEFIIKQCIGSKFIAITILIFVFGIYFIGLGNGNIVEMPTKKKELLKMFPNKEKEIEEFLKSNKISFKDEKDLIVLVNYLDTLN